MSERAKNKGAFHIGTVFMGNVNGAMMQVVDIFHRTYGTGNGNTYVANSKIVAVKDLSNGTIHHCGLSMLEHCDTTILC